MGGRGLTPAASRPTAVLDTHVWIWWVSDRRRLSRPARTAIETGACGVSPVSCWEVAMKVAAGTLQLDREVRLWVRQALSRDELLLAPLTEDAAVTAALLGGEGLHGDPADRMLAATALHLQVPLVTKDARLRAFPRLATVW